jgi:integrase/recombinase XerD
MLQPKHVGKLRDELVNLPVVANIRLKALRALFSWAVEEEEAPHDPTAGVKAIKHVSKGFHSWELNEIDEFEKRHPVGSKARLAMALLLYTACRREDVVRLGSQHVRDGRIRYRQAKNEHRNPVDIDIPVHQDLKVVIEATPSKHLTFLKTEYGRSFTPAGFGNRFREWCNQAGLPHCSAHGLRKAAAARLAKRGATAHEIMAITGHRSLEEVERYTRAAQRGEAGRLRYGQDQKANRSSPTQVGSGTIRRKTLCRSMGRWSDPRIPVLYYDVYFDDESLSLRYSAESSP